MHTASPPAVVAEGLAFGYSSGGGLTRADLTLDTGVMAAVEGPSGSGKSTLLALLGLILSPGAGSLYISGTDTGALSQAERDLLRRRSIGIVLQDLGLLTFLNAWENVAAAFGPPLARHRTTARALLGDLGLAQLADAPVTELSGGQRQRIAVARAAVKQPVLVLADEPTSGLDPRTANSVIQALRSCADQGAAVLLVTHDPAVAASCDQRYVLDEGVLTTAARETSRTNACGEKLG
ncbi:ATP-binding cassette domain-containing protein [Streptomyces sp. ALI-76-A]|jgi:ABC-type lipoprotein export system ATPase subunit|uniref:ABC transporter ATP-binding protein n=1 Tax=Streptomyces sp. ALI-76-A TaxID=3025736 RepID=UPI00256F3146|nr:ATP-binding cassette domain-containing protein [Streptomyces sp. ALI-76-A]MDL5202465.1 ATP-binding cassette domain-containing protein [Streptomyces sp. ALI-76-A]